MLMKMADEFNAGKAPGDPLTRHTLAELAHGQALDSANFGSPYQDGSRFPLGEEPILLARISVTPRPDPTQVLTLLPQSGQGINLDLNEKLVHVLARLLQEAANATEWGLSLRVSPGTPGLTETPPSTAPQRLH